jgi:hypothetical protein
MLIIALSFMLCVLGFPKLMNGMWIAEMPVIGVWCIGLMSFIYSIRSLHRLSYTESYLLVLLAGSLCAMSCHNYPMMDIFGTPQMGEGMLMILSFLGIARLYECMKIRHLILYVAPIAFGFAVIMGCLTFFNYNCYVYKAYFGFIALGLIPFLSLYKLRFQAVLSIIIVFLMYISKNKTAWCVTPLAAGVMMIPQRWLVPYKKWIIAIVAIVPLLMIVGICTIPMDTLIHRRKFLEIIGSYFLHHPWHLLFGQGFGTFCDATVQEILNTSVCFYQNGIFAPNWCGAYFGYSFHTMNLWGELLLSIGMFGLAWIMYLPIAILKAVPIRHFKHGAIMLIYFGAIHSTWFIDAVCYPFILGGICVLLKGCHTQNSRPMALWITIGCCVGLGWGIFKSISCMASYPTANPLYQPYHFPQYMGYEETTGLHMATVLGNNPSAHLLDIAARHIAPKPLFLQLSMMNAINQLLQKNNDYALSDLLAKTTLDFIKQAPRRLDMAIPYLMTLSPTVAMNTLHTFPYKKGPIYEWIMAQLYQKMGRLDLYYYHHNRAIQLGVDRFLQIN